MADLLRLEMDQQRHKLAKQIAISGGANKGGGNQPQSMNLMDMEGFLQLKSILGQKADREQIDVLHKVKQNKIDSELIKDVQIVMCKMFKQILVLFVEVVNCQVARVN